MTLGKLYVNWEDYVWEWRHNGKVFRVVLKERYYKCELALAGKREVPALLFHNRYDDGTWGNNPTPLKCDKDGNCYHLRFSVNNITEYRWRKCGKFVKLSAISK